MIAPNTSFYYQPSSTCSTGYAGSSTASHITFGSIPYYRDNSLVDVQRDLKRLEKEMLSQPRRADLKLQAMTLRKYIAAKKIEERGKLKSGDSR